MLVGWPWVRDTHSFVEPTALAILGLRCAGQADHPRLREGVRLLLDRALPDGGWNYGNTRVFENVLRPFPAPSGVALAALAGASTDRRVDAGAAYLTTVLPGVRAPLSLGWGLIGLGAVDRRPEEAPHWLAKSAVRAGAADGNILYTALLLLADAERPVFSVRAGSPAHG